MFEPENDFERRLKEAVEQPAARPAFMRSLLQETVCLALFPDEKGARLVDELAARQKSGVLPDDVTTEMRVIGIAGVETVPMFSSPGRIWAFTGDTHLVATDTVEAVFRRHPGMGFLLNPGVDYGKHFPPAEAEALLAGRDLGSEEITVAAGSRVLVGAPAEDTSDIRAAMAAHLAAFPEVSAAYLSMASIAGQTPTLLVEVVTADVARADRAALGAPLLSLAHVGRPIDLAIRGNEKSVLARGSVPPFHIKKKRSLLSRLFGR